MSVRLVPPIFNVFRLALGRPEPSGQIALLWLMATACEKNLPLDSAVDALAADAKGQWRYRLEDFAAILRRGTPVDQAIEMVPDLLPPETVLAAKVGVANDALGQALRVEAERQTAMESANVDDSVVGAMLYLSAMLAVQLTLVSFIMIWIIPKFKKIFDDFDMELPAVTQTLIEFADGGAPVALVPICLGAIVIPLVWMLSCLGIRYRSLSLRGLIPRLDVGPILRNLGVVVSEGRPLIDGLHTISTQHPNTGTWRRMSHVYESVKAGEPPWGMMRHYKMLSERERHLLESAERAGNLGWALQALGRQIENKQDHLIRSALQLVRPVCVGTIGLMVAYIVVALFVPVVKIINDLS